MRVLGEIVYYDDPRTYADVAQCTTMRVRNNEEYFVLSVGGVGKGGKTLRIMMRADKKTLFLWTLAARGTRA